MSDIELTPEQLKRKLDALKPKKKKEEKENPEPDGPEDTFTEEEMEPVITESVSEPEEVPEPRKKTKAEENIERSAQLDRAVEKEEKRDADDIAANLSIRDRLMRRTEKTVFKTTFEDDLGDFIVETRLMTSIERSNALKFNQMLGEGRVDFAKYDEAIKGLKQLAAEICVTKGLKEYLQSDDVGDDVIVALVLRSVYGTLEKVGEATSFRKK